MTTARKARDGRSDAVEGRGGARWRAWSAQASLVALGALALYLGLASWSDPSEVVAVIRTLPARAGATVCALVLLGLLLRALRWHYYTRVLALGVRAGPSVLAFVAGFAFTATPGKVGEVVKSFLLRRRFAVPIASTAGVLVVERVTDLLAVLVLAVVGLDRAIGVGSGWALAASAAGLAAAVAFLLHQPTQGWVMAGLSRVPGLRRPVAALPTLLASSRELLRPAPLLLGLLLATFGWSCEALALHALLGALGAPVPVGGALFAFAAATLLGVLSMLPGGLGGFEATMVLILGRLAVPRPAAVAATLLFRLFTLWLVSAIGLVALGTWLLVHRRREP